MIEKAASTKAWLNEVHRRLGPSWALELAAEMRGYRPREDQLPPALFGDMGDCAFPGRLKPRGPVPAPPSREQPRKPRPSASPTPQAPTGLELAIQIRQLTMEG